MLTGLLPIATAIGGVVMVGERPSRAFWLVSLLGLAAVLAFAASMGGGAPQAADLLLLGERVTWPTVLAALAVIGTVALGRKAR